MPAASCSTTSSPRAAQEDREGPRRRRADHRQDPAHPRHLQPARPLEGGQAPGRARPVPVHPAAPVGHARSTSSSRSAARGRASWACAVPARRSSSWTAGRSAAGSRTIKTGLEEVRTPQAPAQEAARAGGDPRGRDRRLHERGQELPAERADRGRGARAGQALRHARPHHPQAHAARGPRGPADGHGRVHPQAPPRPRRRLPGDPGGHRGGRADPARGRREPSADRRPDPGRRLRARGPQGARDAAADRLEQDRSARRRGPALGPQALAPRSGRDQRPHGREPRWRSSSRSSVC